MVVTERDRHRDGVDWQTDVLVDRQTDGKMN